MNLPKDDAENGHWSRTPGVVLASPSPSHGLSLLEASTMVDLEKASDAHGICGL